MTYPRFIHAKVKGNLQEIDSFKTSNNKFKKIKVLIFLNAFNY